ncbi:MAG: hypothetical protein VYD10_03605 [Actinomycetota bacterium]|nr:hypothetical protein [Actinomycetota bacterium]
MTVYLPLLHYRLAILILIHCDLSHSGLNVGISKAIISDQLMGELPRIGHIVQLIIGLIPVATPDILLNKRTTNIIH